MGASNAIAAYFLYGAKVSHMSLRLLVYMALVSKDADEHPWYGQGHEALAKHALRRPEPITETDLRAVGDALRPLRKIGAIEIDRRPAQRGDGPNTTRYRLHLRTADGGGKPSTARWVDGGGKAVTTVEEKPSDGGGKPVTTVEGFPPPEEEEEEEEREGGRSGRPVDASPDRARGHRAGRKNRSGGGEPSGDRAATCSCGVYLDPDGSCFAHPLDKR